MSDDPEKNSLMREWLKPGAILQVIGFVALVAAAWSQIGQNAKDIQNNRSWIMETRAQLNRMDDKLDRIIEREADRGRNER